MEDFLGIAVVGEGLSLVIEVIKKQFGTDSTQTKLLTLALAVVVGGAYVLLRDTPEFPTILMVLASASTVYAYFLK